AAREGGLAGELGPALAAAEAGADPVPHLHRAAETPGLGGAARLAACWTVAAVSGAGLADVAERLAAALAREEAQRADLSAQLAGARTTAVLLAVLPAGGLLMAAFSGGAPLAFLFGSPAGLACLAGGAALDAAGLWWTRGIIRRALPPAEGR
ncbi:type II secretion system F family protein, partial [Nocardiopsis coralliicola]